MAGRLAVRAIHAVHRARRAGFKVKVGVKVRRRWRKGVKALHNTRTGAKVVRAALKAHIQRRQEARHP